jgi:hypothetical protein
MVGLLAVGFGSTCGGRVEVSTDGPDILSPCDLTKPFGPAFVVEGLGSGTAPSLTPDELTIYFSGPTGTGDNRFTILMATRTTLNGAFSSPVNAFRPWTGSVYPSGYNPSVTSTGLGLYFDDWGANRAHISYVIKTTLEEPFDDLKSTYAFEPGLVGNPVGPYISATGRELYYMEEFKGGIWRRTAGDGGWVQPERLVELEVDGFHPGSPVISVDGLTLYFGGYVGSERGQIWMATRSTDKETFDAPHAVAELYTPDGASPGWLSPDSCRLYFTGTEHIRVARRGR